MSEDDFFRLLSRGEGTFTFQTFADAEADKADEVRRRSLTRVLSGTPQQHERTLRALNARGAGVFVTVNGTDLLGRKLANIRDVRAYYTEVDGAGESEKEALLERFLSAPLPPSMVVDSKNGLHAYWLTYPGEDTGPWDEVQHGLRHAFRGDARSKDLARVLRLPGYLHCKDPGDPYPVTVLYAEDLRYDGAELALAYPAPPPPPQPVRVWERPQRPALSRVRSLEEYAASRWGQGSRHALALSVAARLWWWGVSCQEAEQIVTGICRFAGDDDLPDRLQAVRDTYATADAGGAVSSPELRGVRFD